MTLAALIHKRRRGAVATAIPAIPATAEGEKDRAVAKVAAVAVAKPADGVTARAWLLHFADREPREVWYSPAATHAQVLADDPDALAAEPVVPTVRSHSAPMTADEDQAIRAWLARIEETDAATIADVLRQCQHDADARAYFTGRAAADHVSHRNSLRSQNDRGDAAWDDDRRTCTECANLVARRCLAAKRGEIVASRNYEPIPDMLKRCEAYAPGAEDPDRRHGRERWPGLIQKGGE